MDTEATAAQADVPDLELVKGAQGGDSEAFDELVGRYRNRIFGMIYNMVHNEQDAWDLAQDSFPQGLEIDRPLPGAILVLHLALSHRDERDDRFPAQETGQRRRGGIRRRDSIEGDRAGLRAPSRTPMPSRMNGWSSMEIRGRIDAAIAQLSPEHRAVILMKEIEGMQYNEIAESLGCSIGTVMSRLFYARKKLQNLLRDVYENV